MNDDLIKRLERADEYEPLGHDAWEAAAALAEVQAEVARLREALRPFAQAHAWSPHSRFKIVLAGPEGDITGDDLDRARAALTPGKGEGE